MNVRVVAAVAALLTACGASGDDPGKEDLLRRATQVVPHARQLAWQQTEFNAFVHFGINTFTGKEWGTGEENPGVFNPGDLDADQWVSAFRDAGMRGVILTAKHHDGFCLWPSAYTDFSVAASPWREGGGDVLREVAEACRRHGLRFGIYLSPADLREMRPGGRFGNGSEAVPSRIPGRTHGGSAAIGEPLEYELDDYNRYFMNQLDELLTQYGEISQVWLDGAQPRPDVRQEYNFHAWYDLVRRRAPDAVIAVRGPDVRWVGNEAGAGRESEWSVIPLEAPLEQQSWRNRTEGDLGSRSRLSEAAALHWYPAETNVSIRPGWFYRAEEDARLKSLDELLDIYYQSVGNNCVLLLNVPPDRRGRLPDGDVERLRTLGEALRKTYENDLARDGAATASDSTGEHHPGNVLDGDDATCWSPPDGQESAWIEIRLPETRRWDRVLLAEHLESGQRIEAHVVEAWIGGEWRELARGTTVGYKRLHRFKPVESDRLRVRILESRIRPTLARLGLYLSSYSDEERIGRATVTSNGGAFRVEFVTDPLPMPMNRLFTIEGRILDAASGKPLRDGYELTVDAAMPDHGHGMNTQPRTTLQDDGRFGVRGMLLHMAGYWELYFDVTRDGVTERAQYNVTLD